MTRIVVRTALRRSSVPLVVGIIVWALGRHTGAYAVLTLALLVLIVGLVSPATAATLDRLAARAADVAARFVSYALSWVAWMVTVLPTWTLSRLLGSHPLKSKWVSTNSNWILASTAQRRAPNGQVLAPARPSVAETPNRLTPQRRASTAIASFLLVGSLACLAVFVLSPDTLRLDRLIGGRSARTSLEVKAPTRAITMDAAVFDALAVDSYTHEHEPWAPALFGEFSQLQYRSDPFLGISVHDFVGKYVNVRDGRRVSDSPRDPTITVWFFGGSTMFGIGQRDDHTIPSVIARLADQDGLRIKAMNFGYSGFVNWQETQLFDQLLTSGAEPPDLAVFYDGVNDVGLGSFRLDIGIDDPNTIARLPNNDVERSQMKQAHGNVEPMPWGPERAALEVSLVATQYRRGADLARISGQSYGVPVVHIWQPQPFAKEPNPADDELWKRLDFNPAFLTGSRATYDQIRENSGVDPIDMTHVLDDVKQPVFFDSSHTNELGAKIIATNIYKHLRPQLKAANG